MPLHEKIVGHRNCFWKRTVILGILICLGSVFGGIALIFWREYGPDLPKMPASIASQLLLQATAGPIYIAVAFMWPITLPLLLVIVVMVYMGARLRRIWLPLAAFLLMGLYWLWIVKLLSEGAFD